MHTNHGRYCQPRGYGFRGEQGAWSQFCPSHNQRDKTGPRQSGGALRAVARVHADIAKLFDPRISEWTRELKRASRSLFDGPRGRRWGKWNIRRFERTSQRESATSTEWHLSCALPQHACARQASELYSRLWLSGWFRAGVRYGRARDWR